MKKEKKDPSVFLEHILESIGRIEEYAKRKSKKEFLDDYEKQDAIIKRLEVIGEAVKNIPRDIKKKYPEVPWKKIAGMRDILIHEYFGIDLDLVWKIIIKDIPKFKKQILELLAEIFYQQNHK